MQQTQLTTFQTKILIGIFLFLLLTPIRSIAIMVSPLFVYGIYCLHHFKMQRGTGWLFALWGGTSLIGILNETTNWQNVLVLFSYPCYICSLLNHNEGFHNLLLILVYCNV